MAGVGTEESYAAVTGSRDDDRLTFANATYAGLGGDGGVEARSGYSGDPDHAAPANATDAGVAGVGTEESYEC